MSEIQLVNFDLRGRAESIRMVLKYAGQEFEDTRVQLSEWPKDKPGTPYGQMPYMTYKGKVYGQSNAIAVYFAQEFGLFGKTTLDGLRINEVIGLWNDQLVNIVHYRLCKDEEKKAAHLKTVLEEDTPKYFGFYENLLQDSGHFVNDELSLADLYVFDMQDNLLRLKPDVLEGYKCMQKLRHNVKTHPRLKDYLENRKNTVY